VRLRRPTAKFRWWLTRTVPLRDNLGNIVKWYGDRYRHRGTQACFGGAARAQEIARVSRVTTMGELTASSRMK